MDFEGELRDRTRWRVGGLCSMTRVLEVLSTRTAFQVLRELFFGTVRFDDFVERTESSAPAVSRALKQLEAAGIVARSPYREQGKRTRDQYRLTGAGEELLPVFLSLVQWGDRHLQDAGAPIRFVDTRTGRAVGVRVCTDEHPTTTPPADIEIRRGATP